MLFETVDVNYWLLMPSLMCISLIVLIMAVSSGERRRRCCKSKSFQCDLPGRGKGKKCSQDNLSKADESHNLANDDVLLDILKPLRNLDECHYHPYLFQPSPIKLTDENRKRGCIDRNRNIVNILSEQVHSFPVGFRELVLNPDNPNGTDISLPIQGDESFVVEDQIQEMHQSSFSLLPGSYHIHRTTSPVTQQSVLAKKSGQCGNFDTSERPYAELTSSAGNFRSSYTSLKFQATDLYMSATSSTLTQSANGGLAACNNTLPDTNAYNYTLPDSDVYSDIIQLSDDSIARPTVATWHDGKSSRGRRSGLDSGHYSSLGPHDYEKVMSGIYDTIQENKYLTVCTTSPACIKQQHELQEQNKAELAAAKQKTITSAGKIELKTSFNEIY